MSAVEAFSSLLVQSRQLHKFGGSSLADPDCFLRVVQIIRQCSGNSDLIVVSAAGKTTNRLIEWLGLVAQFHPDAEQVLQSLAHYQQDLIDNLIHGKAKQPLLAALQDDIQALMLISDQPLTDASSAWAQGFGELWSARLLSALLNQHDMPSVLLDSRTFLSAERGVLPAINRHRSLPLLQQALADSFEQRVVITGFMARNCQGETVLLGRNGSDYSATIIGALANVERVTIWSDVAGVYSADPQKVAAAQLLPVVSIDEAAELARLGASVLHSRTLQPIAQSNIDLNLRSSHLPDAQSTLIERTPSAGSGAKIVTALQNVCLLQLEFSHAQHLPTAHQAVMAQLESHQILPLTSSFSQEHRRLQLAYSEEVVNRVFELLAHIGIDADICLRQGFSMLAAVGAGVTRNANHCHAFYQQLNGQLLEFIGESPDGFSIIAILRQANPDDLVADIHQVLFQAKPRVGIVLQGRDGVAAHWLDLFAKQQKQLEQRYGIGFELIAVQDIDWQFGDMQGIDPTEALALFERQARSYRTGNWLDNQAKQPFEHILLIDTSDSESVAQPYLSAAEQGFHLISANPHMGSLSAYYYRKIQQNFEKNKAKWHIGSAIAGNLPICQVMTELNLAGDQLVRLDAVMSGTLSVLLAQISPETPFSQLLEQAWRAGITTTDPRMELSGGAAARRLVLLARLVGIELDLSAIDTHYLLPAELMTMPLTKFFTNCAMLDSSLARWQQHARDSQGTLCYIARLYWDGATNRYRGKIELEVIAQDDPLARCREQEMLFLVETKNMQLRAEATPDLKPYSPINIQGIAIGDELVARALLADLNRFAAELA